MVDSAIPRIQDLQNPNEVREIASGKKTVTDQNSHKQQVPQGQKRTASSEEPSEADESQSQQPPKTEEELAKEVEQLNSLLGQDTRIAFRVDQEAGRLLISLVDKETDEVIKTLPPDEIDEVRSKLTTASFLIDRKR